MKSKASLEIICTRLRKNNNNNNDDDDDRNNNHIHNDMNNTDDYDYVNNFILMNLSYRKDMVRRISKMLEECSEMVSQQNYQRALVTGNSLVTVVQEHMHVDDECFPVR
jgi:hypothetical protein